MSDNKYLQYQSEKICVYLFIYIFMQLLNFFLEKHAFFYKQARLMI